MLEPTFSVRYINQELTIVGNFANWVYCVGRKAWLKGQPI